jgi:phosphotransferase system enzyme I (PtsP)
VSVGSNDLTQYLLAVDRNNPSVSSLFDSYHPGILRALKLAVDECEQYDLDVSVCGELAGEPYGALVLVAMGYRKLSMNQASLARINYILRRVSQQDLSELLTLLLMQSNGQQVRTLLGSFVENNGLDDLINP